MTTDRITRHYANIESGRWGGRQVHYRRVGSGPVVICFHQSPLSSRDMLATMERWKTHFTCIAPDSPGFGLSDPLAVASANMRDFADAAIEFMDALGIERAAVYGFHTGAMISAAIAAAYPERIVCAAANGYVMLSEAERADIVANYLPELKPSWDGAHLTWLWARMREQLIFFPWYRKSLADRMYVDLPPPAALHAGLLDFMRSGDHYRVGYRAAFTMRSDLALRETRVPVLVTANSTDVLAKQLPRIRNVAPTVTVQVGGDVDATHDLCRNFIARHEPPKPPQAVALRALTGRLSADYVTLSQGQLRLRRNDDAAGRPVIVLHDALGSSETMEKIARGFIGRRPVIAINLAGHGESDQLFATDEITIEAHAKVLQVALAALGIQDADIVGIEAGGLVGLELATLAPKLIRNLAMISVPYHPPTTAQEMRGHYAPDIQPNWFGGHLLEAWYVVRDHGLFFPWYERNRKGALRQEPSVDPVDIHQRVFELFRSEGQWRALYDAQFAYPLAERLRQSKVSLQFAAAERDPLANVTQAAARDFPKIPVLELPDEPERWARALLQSFDRE